MASGAFRRAPKGFCDLPEVPDVPDRRADAIRALLGGADGDVMAEAILARYREVGLEEGDEDAIAEETLRILLQDNAVCDEIIAAFKPDVSSLCAERGWPTAPFVKCKCSGGCIEGLTRNEPGRDAIDRLARSLREAAERAPLPPRPAADDGTWLQPFANVTHAQLDAFLVGRRERAAAAEAAAGPSLKDAQLAAALELETTHGCCRSVSLAFINRVDAFLSRKRKRGAAAGSSRAHGARMTGRRQRTLLPPAQALAAPCSCKRGCMPQATTEFVELLRRDYDAATTYDERLTRSCTARDASTRSKGGGAMHTHAGRRPRAALARGTERERLEERADGDGARGGRRLEARWRRVRRGVRHDRPARGVHERGQAHHLTRGTGLGA